MRLLNIRTSALTLAVAASAMGVSQIRQLPPSPSVQGVSMNTLSMIPQVNPGRAIRFFEKIHTPRVYPDGPANDLLAGGTLSTPRISTRGGALFPGIGNDGGYGEPPDPDIAVGPNHIVEVVNSDIAFINKATGAITFQQAFQQFFASINPEPSDFDPKVIYDQVGQRWVVVDLGLQESGTTSSSLLVGVSDDSDPNGSWKLFKLNVKVTEGGDAWLDYPGLGYNKNSIVFSGNMFPFGDNATGGTQIICLDKATLYGGTANMVKFQIPSAFTTQLAKTYDATSDSVYAVATQSRTQVEIFAITNTNGNFNVVSQFVNVPRWESYNPIHRGPGGVPIQSNDPRMLVAAARNGRVVASHSVGVSSSDSRCTARWYEFRTNGWPQTPSAVPTLSQSGQLTPPAGHIFNFPAVCIDNNGAIGLAFTKIGPTTPGDLIATGRRPTDPLGTMGQPVTLDVSTGATYNGFSTRWGDYFDLELDPSDGRTMWAVGMGAGRNRLWQTYINKFSVSVPDAALINIVPDGVSTVAGRIVGGDRISLFASDANVLSLRSVPVRGLGQTAGINTVYTLPFSQVQTLRIALRASGVTGSTAQIQAQNVATGVFETLSTVTLTPAGVDKSLSIDTPALLSRYVGAGGEVRLIVRGVLPVRSGRMPGAFTFAVDRFVLLGAEVPSDD